MARGKHATSAEARRARETAEAEVRTTRRKVDELERANADLSATLSEERARHVAEIRRLNALVDAGTSDEVRALRERLRTAGKRAKEERISRAKEVIHEVSMLGTTDAAVVGVLYRIAEIYGANPAEIRKMDGAKRRKVTNSVLSLQFPIMESMMDRNGLDREGRS